MLIAALISWVTVGYAVRRVTTTPPQIVFDAQESIEYAAQALPDSITGDISYVELQKVLRLHLEWLQAFHWSPEGASKTPIVFDELEPIDYIKERAGAMDFHIDSEYLEPILKSHYDYLAAIGAIHTQDKSTTELDLRSAKELTK